MASEEKNNDTKVFTKEEPETKQPKRRKEVKQSKSKEKRRGFLRNRIRYIPVWLRLVIVIALCIAAFLIGVSAGYTVIGDGSDTDRVLDLEYWKDLWDYIQGEEQPFKE